MAENRARNWTQQPQTQQQSQQQQSVRPEEDVFLLGVDQILAKLNSRIFEEKAANFSSGSGSGHNSNSFSSPTSNPNSSINNNISNGSPTISSTSTSGKSPFRAVPAPAVVTRDPTPFPSPPDSPLPSSYFSPPKSSKKTSSLSSLAASFVPNFGESPTTTNAQLHVALANVAAAAAAFQHQQQQFQQHQQQSLQQQQQKQQQQQQSNICSSSSHHQSSTLPSSSSGASNGPIQQSFGHITGLQHFNRMVAPSALAAVAAASSFLPLPPLPPPPPPGLASLWATFASPRAHQSSQSSYISSSMSHAKVAADAAVAATINSEHNLFEAQCVGRTEVATNSGGSAAENSLSSSGVSSTTSPSSSNSGSPNNSSSSLLSIAEQQQQQQSSTSQSVGVTAGDSSSSSPSSSSTVINKNCSPSAHFSPNAADQSFNPFGPAIFDFSRLGMTGGLNALLSSGSPSSEALPGGGGSPRSRSHSVLVHPHHPLSFAAVANGGHHSMAISSPIISSSSGPGSGSGSPSNAVVAFTKEEKDLELKAKSHREAASRLNECDKIYSITRFDNKPPRDAQYSTKVFIGGVPWDMNNDDMMEVFEPFGATSIQRPGKDVRLSRSSQGLDKAGYLYLIFESEPHVHSLLKYCKLEMTDGGHRYFYMLYSKRSKKEKRVQVIPWNTADSVCMVNPAAKEDQARTVFLGALHGMMNSKAVVDALTRIFGPVEFVSLDTDKYKYPMGSGRAMFTRHTDYLKAVNAGFVRVKSDRFEKTIQIDQFLDDKDCCRCGAGKAPVFCKACQKYYCKVCWTCLHADESAKNHPILMKSRFNSKI